MSKNKVIQLYPDINDLLALRVKDGAVQVDGLFFESIEDVPEEIRHLAKKALSGKHTTDSGTAFNVKVVKKTN